MRRAPAGSPDAAPRSPGGFAVPRRVPSDPTSSSPVAGERLLTPRRGPDAASPIRSGSPALRRDVPQMGFPSRRYPAPGGPPGRDASAAEPQRTPVPRSYAPGPEMSSVPVQPRESRAPWSSGVSRSQPRTGDPPAPRYAPERRAGSPGGVRAPVSRERPTGTPRGGGAVRGSSPGASGTRSAPSAPHGGSRGTAVRRRPG
jgi:hypothetical protein